MTDKLLTINVKKGDLNGFHLLYARFRNRIFFFSLSYLKSKDKAEDIVQDVFAKVWEKRDCLDENLSLNNFLFTVTKNLVLNQIRGVNYDIAYRKNCLTQSEVWAYQQNNTLDSVLFNDLKSYLYNEIEKLPAGMKGIFKLSRIQMLSNEEIAKNQNLSVRTVENQIYRAVLKLREKLVEESAVPCIY
jgi:RNA polymerase sigma-70 factor (ECF subfamily)